MKKRVLIVVTSCEKFPNLNRATGLWLGEAVHFVDPLVQAGYEIDYVSPLGGFTPIDPDSFKTAPELDWKYYRDKSFMNQLGATKSSESIQPSKYGVIYYAGGHGTVFDFPTDARLPAIAGEIYAAGGVVASICHGACGLLGIAGAHGEPLIRGKAVTGFSNQEEQMAGLVDSVPFLTEEELRKKGADYRKAERPFTPFAVTSERVVTGQNPQSGRAVAERVLALL
jgi:putative intracellular protease/amidase